MNVPFYSQYAPEVPEQWRDRACGVVALKMALDSLGADTPEIADLLKEAEAIGAFKDGYWVHQRLTWLAHNYGVPAYSEEFRSDTVDVARGAHVPGPHTEALCAFGIKKIQTVLGGGGLVLASVSKHFEPGGSHHLVLLTEATKDGFEYNDPAYETPGEGMRRSITEDVFREHWRTFAIFLEKNSVVA